MKHTETVGDYRVEIGDSDELRFMAQKIRYEVFNMEFEIGLPASRESGLDEDPYDKFCDHLIVSDLNSNTTIATCRLLRDEAASQTAGFYSEQEFDLDGILRRNKNLLEMGRLCIRHEHRKNPRIFSLIFKTIGRYLYVYDIHYLFGCASLYTLDPTVIGKTTSMLKTRGYFHDTIKTPALGSSEKIEELLCSENEQKRIYQELPSLIKNYLSVGVKVCGGPFLDAEFGTCDYLVLLDLESEHNPILTRILRNSRNRVPS